MDDNIAKSTHTKVPVMPDGLVALQVDDSLICGSAVFLQAEEERVRQFECKTATKVIDDGECVTFNGADLYLKDGVYHLSLRSKCEKIDAHVTVENFISQRALAAYMALWARPRLLGRIQILFSSAAAPSPKNVDELRSILQELKTVSEELLFRPLDLANGLRVVCFTDAGFASHADDFKSQLGFVIAIVDADNRATVVAYGSRKGRRVTRSVLVSELFALVEGFDTAAAIAYQLSEILSINVPVWVAVDSRTLFTVVTRMGHVSEKRFMVDVAELRDQYVQDKLKVFWIPSSDNCADPLTKARASTTALEKLLDGTLHLNSNAWVEHLAARNVFQDCDVMPL
jgi:hypothetical protein